MDYSLHVTYSDPILSNSHSHHHQNQSQIHPIDNILRQQDSNNSNNNRSYSVFNNDHPNAATALFDSNNSPSMEEDTLHSPMLLISTRPSIELHDPWHSHRLHHPNDMYAQDHCSTLPALPHSERGIAGFVSKLYQCLQSNDGNQQYARWCKHDGKDMFIIDRIPEFTEVVLPRLFKHCKFPSFVRQLNIYGFQRDTDARKSKDTKDKDSCRWYHPCFRPGRRDLFHLIRRKATRYSRKKKAKTSADEDDPETILIVGSGDESDLEDDPNPPTVEDEMSESPTDVRKKSFNECEEKLVRPGSSSRSPLSRRPSMQLTDSSSRLPPNSDSPHNTLPLMAGAVATAAAVPSSPALSYPNNSNGGGDLAGSDKADDSLVNNHNLVAIVGSMQSSSFMHDHDQLRLQLYHMKQQYERMHGYFEKQLAAAQIQIEKQQLRIGQLENALGLTITKHPVKQSTTAAATTTTTTGGGYVYPTNYLHQQLQSQFLTDANNHLYEMQHSVNHINQHPMATPALEENSYARQHNCFYFQQNGKLKYEDADEDEEDSHHNNNKMRTMSLPTNTHSWPNTPHDYSTTSHQLSSLHHHHQQQQQQPYQHHHRLATVTGNHNNNAIQQTEVVQPNDELKPVLLSASTSSSSSSTPLNAPDNSNNNNAIYSSTNNHMNFNAFM
ncbi:MAG: HSF-type DNA-binding-domain-containing protein [Benjaminiella poitrasii]|nr:MAG: HSF-type DNA-binding-domain-containing protein [Benjaminiella poitrasii]